MIVTCVDSMLRVILFLLAPVFSRVKQRHVRKLAQLQITSSVSSRLLMGKFMLLAGCYAMLQSSGYFRYFLIELFIITLK